MYLFILDDWSTYKSNSVLDEELEACDDGYLSIIDMETQREYNGGEWQDIEVFSRGKA